MTPSRWACSSSSAEETEAAGARLAAELSSGDVVLVSGDLGAGKTAFVRGACRRFGVTARVTSPTFTIGHLYAGTPDVAHMDLYRLDRVDDSLIDEYLTPDRIGFVEWPEAADGQIERVAARVHIAHAGHDERRITVT